MNYTKLWWLTLTSIVLIAALLLAPLPKMTGTAGEPAPILIIDPGHGGEDGGAVAPDGTLESDINLDIALRLEALAAFWGADTVMTRARADIEYPPQAATLAAKKRADQNDRLERIRETPGGFLLSIHQNYYPAQAPWGIQVFYGDEPGGEPWAAILQDNLTRALAPDNRRLAEPIDEGIYLMRKAQCPAVLVECGFLSNPSDLDKLRTEGYRLSLAAVMLGSYLQYIRGTVT